MECAVALSMRQRHTAHRRPQHLRRRRCRLPSWLPWREACACRTCVLQRAPHDAWYPPHPTQGDTPQGAQPDHPMCVLQTQRRQRQRAPVQPSEALGDQGLAARRRAPLGQAPLLNGVMGRIDAPAQAPPGVGGVPWSPGVCRSDVGRPWALQASRGRAPAPQRAVWPCSRRRRGQLPRRLARGACRACGHRARSAR